MLCQFLLMMHLTTVFQIKLKSLEHELHSQYCLTGEIPSIMYNKVQYFWSNWYVFIISTFIYWIYWPLCSYRALQKNMRLLCCSNGFYCHTYWPLILFKRFRKIGEIHPFCLIFIAKSVLEIILKALEIVVHVFKRGDLYKASIKLIYTDKCMYCGSKQILVHEAYLTSWCITWSWLCLKCVKVQDEHSLVLAVDLSLWLK